jgi:arylsulfatase A-like enzyme
MVNAMPIRLLVFCFVSYLGSASPALAYVDPNAAGLIFQILTPILAVLAAGVAFLRMWSARWISDVRSAVHGISSPSHPGLAPLKEEEANGPGSQPPISMPALLLALWKRLTAIASVLLLLNIVLYILSAFDGWLAYVTPWEAVMSVAWHLALAVVEGVALGALGTAVIAPILAVTSVQRRVDRARTISSIALVAGATLAGVMLLRELLQWSASIGFTELSSMMKRVVALTLVTSIATLLVFRRSRARTLQSFDRVFNGSVTRRTLITTGVSAAAAALIDSKLAATNQSFSTAGSARKDARNIVLITFDALGAQHMSLYGCPLPTTSNIDAFAQFGTTFTNFYSCSTYTTPSVVACLTGRYPSETLVYQVTGFLRGRAAERNLARELRAAGYVTAASVGNPWAHPDHIGIGDDFDFCPAPPQRFHPLSTELVRLHDHQLFAYSIGQEQIFLQQFDQFSPVPSEWPPERGFAQAQDLLSQIGNRRPFFLWVHILAPHIPYKPDPPYLHRFLPGDEMRRLADTVVNVGTEGYTPDRQPLVDKQRLRYAEFVAECDGAFGTFMSFLEARGAMNDTAIIVSADHGESFKGGVFTHGGPVQLRQIVHIPLVIRLPHGELGKRVTVAADQTSLAPTILEIAGVPQPSWMRERSLLPFVNQASTGPSEGYAFTQYFGGSSIFEPVRRGTVGVIDGVNQFVVDLESRKGILRPLAEADLPDTDHSAENPVLAARLRKRIFARFPTLSDDIG